MASFLEVCRAVAPGARPLRESAAAVESAAGSKAEAGAGASTGAGVGVGGEAQVGWVRVLKPRVPALDALEPGDLVIVPAGALAVVAPGPAEVADLVGALADARIAGVLVVESEGTSAGEGGESLPDAEGGRASPGGEGSGVPESRPPRPEVSGSPNLGHAFAKSLAEAAVPARIVPRADPSALERAAIGYLVNRRAELERQAADLERAVERLALAGRGPEALAAAIGGFVGRPVVIERRRGEPLAIHASVAPSAADAAAVTGAVSRYHARPAEVPYRLPLPGADGRPIGALVVLGDAPVGERERIAAERVATVLALALGRIPAVVTPAVGREGLPAAGPPWVVVLGRQARRESDTLPAREAVRAEIALLAGPDRLLLRGDASSLELRAVVAADPDDPSDLALVERIAEALGRGVAVSRRFDDPSGRPAAEAEARTTLEAAERFSEDDRPVVARAERLPAYRLLGDLANLPDGLRQARALLEPLLAGSPSAQRDRLATLRAVLEHDGAADVAAALGVHRNTVAYRVRTIERLGGWNLADPEMRLALAIAVRIVQTAQA